MSIEDDEKNKARQKYEKENAEYLRYLEEEKMPGWKKFLDFTYGILVFGAIDAAITWVMAMILKSWLADESGFGKGIAIIFITIIIIYANATGIAFNKGHRTYFMYGIMSLYIYPFLLLGSCWV